MTVTLQDARAPAVAGTFYPAQPDMLRQLVRQQLAQVSVTATEGLTFISPHAGLQYSGPVAAHVYARVGLMRDRIRTVVLLGPAHYVAVHGVVAPSASAFATPLGVVPVAKPVIERIGGMKSVHIRDDAHEPEHSLEVQLPFLQEVLGEFDIVPLLCGRNSEVAACDVLDALCDRPDVIAIASSDLSHFHPYEAARQHDAATTRAIEALDPERVGPSDACGYVAVRALLLYARRHALSARVLDLRNSGDTAGPRTSVVGYGAFEFVAT